MTQPHEVVCFLVQHAGRLLHDKDNPARMRQHHGAAAAPNEVAYLVEQSLAAVSAIRHSSDLIRSSSTPWATIIKVRSQDHAQRLAAMLRNCTTDLGPLFAPKVVSIDMVEHEHDGWGVRLQVAK